MHPLTGKVATRTLAVLAGVLLALLAAAGYFDREVLADVPAATRPAARRARIAAVYLSGDVGYRLGMGRKLGNLLAADGIPVVAVNSLAFFRPHRSVAEVTALLARAIARALALGHADQVVLIGHSLGADALQAGLADLPIALRPRVRAVVLIVPTSELVLRVSPAEMLDWAKPDGQVLPSLRKLTWPRLTCIHGVEERDSPCRFLSLPNVTSVALPGGHALHWDVDRLHHAVLDAIDRAAPANITKDSETAHPAASGAMPASAPHSNGR